MQNKWTISQISIIIIACISIFLLGFNTSENTEPSVVYKVYLDGQIVGTVESKTDFEAYINTKEEQIKDKYNVDTVYTPKGVELKKYLTYNNKTDSNEFVYTKIIANKKFTIKGYTITIEYKNEDEEQKKQNVTINVLDKKIFDEALTRTIKSFVDIDSYNEFMEGNQKPLEGLGSLIENIDMKEKVTYRENYISTDEKIFTDVDELSKYLLYGTTNKQNTYIVKEGDTIEDVASANKLNVQEFLIANPTFSSANNLLYAGQEVIVGLVNPIINIVVDVHSVEEEERNYETEIQYDENEYVGYQAVIREGEKGLYQVTRKYQYFNGQLVDSTNVAQTEIKPSVSRIIVKGDKYAPSVADLSYWAWPTDQPYVITSYYEWRWGTFHNGIDISGTGYGSNIYAANNGVVYRTGSGCVPGYGNTRCNGGQGNFVVINHNIGGYYTVYMHLKDVLVEVGQTVARGQKIGTMGNSGDVYPIPDSYNPYGGTHLHFGVYMGQAYGSTINPYNLY